MLYIGADHRGWELKEALKKWLKSEGHEVEDVGNRIFDPDDDSLDSAVKVAEMVEGNQGDMGILCCGSGHGEDMAANRFPGVRAILGFNRDVTIQGREHWDANILVIPAEWVSVQEAKEWTELFLTTEKSTNERYERRRSRLAALIAK